MTNASVAIDRLEALEIALHFAAKVTFDRDLVGIDGVNDGIELLGREVFSAGIWVNVGLFKNFRSVARPHAVNVGQGSDDAFVSGDIYSK